MLTKTKAPVIFPIIVPSDSKHGLLSYNLYLVENDNYLFLIDGGINTEDTWDKFCAVLTENNFTLADLDGIILTHSHDDHIGIIHRILEKRQVPVYAHEYASKVLKFEQSYINEQEAFFKQLYQEMGTSIVEEEEKIDHFSNRIENLKKMKINQEVKQIKDGDLIFGFRVIETPGHAQDQIVLYHESTKIMFSGDHFIAHSSSNAIIGPDLNGERTKALIVYEESLKKCLNYPISIGYSGHGERINDVHGLLYKKLKKIEDKGNKFLKLLKEPHTADEVARIFYKSKYEQLFKLVMSEVIGHLDRLTYQGKVKCTKKNGVYYYEAK